MSGRIAIRNQRYLARSGWAQATAIDTIMIAATVKARICPARAFSGLQAAESSLVRLMNRAVAWEARLASAAGAGAPVARPPAR
jgi:hypothetical protein